MAYPVSISLVWPAKSSTKAAIVSVTDAPRLVLRGKGHLIEVQDVCFRYPGQEKDVLSGINLTVHPGETVGYGRTYRADADRVIATLPTGYADGYNRLLSNCGHVLINGQSAPIVGRVCMDQLMVDVTGLSGVHPGCEVVLLNHDTYTADDMAQAIGTIGYEIVCDISSRVERVYLP